MSAKRQRKSYAPAYRREAAHLVINTGRPIAVVAREIGVGEAVLGRWVSVERSRLDHPPEGLDLDERSELARLRVEVAELRMDREFLKEVAMAPGAPPGADENPVRAARSWRGLGWMLVGRRPCLTSLPLGAASPEESMAWRSGAPGRAASSADFRLLD